MPLAKLVTVPAPAPSPVFETVRTGFASKVAVTDFEASIVTTHESVPVHPPPLHPAKLELGFGDAVSVTDVFRL
jgi:hypothetical protein